MKQKKIGDILYVFKTEAYKITQDTDAEVIYVQAGFVEPFKELNTDLANAIKPYNYLTMVAQTPVWAPYVDEPDPAPTGPQDPTGPEAPTGPQDPTGPEAPTGNDAPTGVQ